MQLVLRMKKLIESIGAAAQIGMHATDGRFVF
jgi:hypothetical protein